ncbi:MAG TPA: hypothetical protein VJ695_02610 [Nitrososphaera sp.]|nr:hypothetical protein [Nitrososphaera sp.]
MSAVSHVRKEESGLAFGIVNAGCQIGSGLGLAIEALDISINHLHYLNDNTELDNLADNLKQEFMNKIREMEGQGLFVNPGEVNLPDYSLQPAG